MSTVTDSREVHLTTRPVGWPRPGNFELLSRPVAAEEGQVLVHNRFLSVDPYMRGRMNDARSYVPPFALGRVMDGGAVGEVVAAPSGGILAPGDAVLHNFGWREYAVGPPDAFQRIDPAPGVALSTYLGALGMPGLTAYVGLLDVAGFQPGEGLFVSAAAGAVGSLVGQLAKLRGAGLVIGSAGSDRKVEHLTRELGFDAAFNYHDGDVTALLLQAVGDRGIDVYFDNVGGDQLEAALTALNQRGRVVMCGSVSRYNAEAPLPGPRNLGLVVGKRLRLQGFLVTDHQDRRPDFLQEVGDHIGAGRIKADETVVDGIENMVDAFIEMMRGANLGKMLVRVSA
ncbi:MAG TPA: NADP-dependent oxidoreductase [Candidatus Dormibacteraeota bacterium]|nr:NADP-dependent oxidoreductase [Candidatus Dormibacteraeota bacterium]